MTELFKFRSLCNKCHICARALYGLPCAQIYKITNNNSNYTKASKEDVINRLNKNYFPKYTGEMIEYLKNEYNYDYEKKDDTLFYNIKILNILWTSNNQNLNDNDLWYHNEIKIKVSIYNSQKVELLQYTLIYKYNFGILSFLKINNISIYDTFYSCPKSIKEKLKSTTELDDELDEVIMYDVLSFIKSREYDLNNITSERFIKDFNDNVNDLYKKLPKSCYIKDYIDNSKDIKEYVGLSVTLKDDIQNSIRYSLDSLGRNMQANLDSSCKFEEEDAKEIVDSFMQFVDTLSKISTKYYNKSRKMFGR